MVSWSGHSGAGEDSMIGSVIKDTYRIDRYLGEGGPSVVYLGTDLLLNAPVAIKRLKLQASLGDGSSMAERFLREARTHARLIHQNIVGIRAVLSENGEFFIVMEYVDGGDMAHLIKHSPGHQLSVADAVSLFGQALLGLDYAHRNKVIHRDIKPSNILVNQEQCAKIADFGLARAVTDHKITGTGFLVGTLSYMSPEQLQGQEAKPASDIYSIGVSLYEALAGRHPFVRNGEKPTPQEIFGRHMFDAPPLLSTVREDIPLSLSEVVNRSIAKDPLDRYADCIAFAEALQQATEHVQSSQSGGHLALALSMQSGANRGADLSGFPSTGTAAIDSQESPVTQESADGTGAFAGRDQTPLRPPAGSLSGPSSQRLASGEPMLPSPATAKGTREVQRHQEIPLRPPIENVAPTSMPSGDTIFERQSPVPRSWSPSGESSLAGEHPVPGVGPTSTSSATQLAEQESSSLSPALMDTDVVHSSEIAVPSESSAAITEPRPQASDTWKEQPSPLPRQDGAKRSSRWGLWAVLMLLVLGGVAYAVMQSQKPTVTADGAVVQVRDGGNSDYWPLASSAVGVPNNRPLPRQKPDASAGTESSPNALDPLVDLASYQKQCKSKPGQMVFIPPGTYMRGRPYRLRYRKRLRNAPQQRIHVSGFCMDTKEVTVGDYRECVEKGFCIAIPWLRRWRWKKKRYRGKTVTQVLPADQPMRYVRWQDAQLYCRWAHKRLPTEAEWEWAARGLEGWSYPWGNQRPNCRRAISRSCRTRGPLPANEKRKVGSNPFGVVDLSGNVAEWVRDCYDPKGYLKARRSKNLGVVNDPLFDEIPCKQRVIRGGSFRHRKSLLRSYVRMKRPSQFVTRWVGFRCVASVRRK